MTVQQHWADVLDGVEGAPNRQGPLRGVTVLDITRVVAGPYCAMMLGDLGATVIKIEHPDEPDYARDFPPFVGEGEGRFSGFFAQFNRNKLGVTLNLKAPEGQELLRELVRRADVVVENFRPGTMDKLGVGYETLREENPALVYTAISGFGQYGPSSRKPAYDNSGQATGGLWSINGYPDRPPARVGTIIGDLSASLYAAFGTVAALREAERTGTGQLVDVSQQDAVLSLTENAVVSYTVDREDPRAAGQRPSVRAPLRPVPLPGRPCLLRRLHAEAVGRELPHLRPARADRRSGDRDDGAALRRVHLRAPGQADRGGLVRGSAPRTSSRRWPPTGFR